MSKPFKIALGVLTIIPFVTTLGLLVFGGYQAVEIFMTSDPVIPMLLLSYLKYISSFLIFNSLLYLGLGVFYTNNILKNGRLDTEKKVLWIIVLALLNGISMPVYWYLHIWNRQSIENPELNPSLKTFYEPGTKSPKL